MVLTQLSSLSRCWAYTPAEGNISFIALMGGYKTAQLPSSYEAQAPFLGGFGLIGLGDLNSSGSLEIQMSFMNKLYVVNNDDKLLIKYGPKMHMVMGYRQWWTQKFSTSLGLSSSYPIRPPDTLRNDFSPGLSPITSADDAVNYGFELALQYEVYRINEDFYITTEARYNHSVSRHYQESMNHYGLTLGLRYFVQEKPSVAPPEHYIPNN